MKTKKYILAVVIMLLGLSACDDNAFLTEDPRTVYTTENSYETVDQVKACITNLYVHIRYWYQIDNFMRGLGSDVMDQPYFRSSGYGYSYFPDWSSTSNSASGLFNALFQLANYANQSLEGWNTESLTWDSQTEKQEAYGEIMFFRGYAYLSLAEMYGGVPLVDQFYQTLKLDFTRATRQETYEFAIKDLEAAADALPTYPSEAGRVAKGAAYHFLAEAYLALAIINGNNSSYLSTAIDYADKVMSLHPLMTERFGTRSVSGAAKNGIDSYYADGDVFFDLFQEGNYDYEEGNTEALWTLQNDYAVQHAYGGDNYVPDPRNLSPVPRDVRWADEYMEDGAGAGPWTTGDIDETQYPGGNVSAYVGGRGVANNCPTTYVINDIWDGNYWNDMRNNSTNIRRELVVMDKNHSLYGQVVQREWLNTTEGTSYTEFFPIWTKIAPVDDWGYDEVADGGDRSNIHCDRYACRSAETLLLRAEAYYRAGNTSAAVNDINQLRSRAQCDYKVTDTDVNIQFILDERARELYGEERRWATLLRMGDDGIKSVNAHAFCIVEQEFWKGLFSPTYPQGITSWTLFPIPQSVIDTNTGAEITQNPGW